MGKITDEELKEINDLRIKLTTTVGEVGQATLQISMLEEDKKVLETTVKQQTLIFQELLEQERTIVKRLSEKYGTGSIDFETGEFTPEK